MKLDVYDIHGQKVNEVKFELPDIHVSDYELAQIIRAYETNIHQGTKSAKTRGEVAFSKRKPWRQKGTGRARSGTRGSPIWVGGGVAHAPKPFQRRLHINKKQKIRVFSYLLKEAFSKVKTYILDVQNITDLIKTKQAKEFMQKIGLLPHNTFLVATVDDKYVVSGFNNLKHVTIRRAELLNSRDLLRGFNLVITMPAIEVLKSRVMNND